MSMVVFGEQLVHGLVFGRLIDYNVFLQNVIRNELVGLNWMDSIGWNQVDGLNWTSTQCTVINKKEIPK